MDLGRIIEAAGLVWGKATTIALAAGVAVLAIPLPAAVEPDWIKWSLFGVAVVVGVLRQVAPPPPAATILRDDSVHVDRIANTITIAKAADIPANMRSKAAGAAPSEPPPPQS